MSVYTVAAKQNPNVAALMVAPLARMQAQNRPPAKARVRRIVRVIVWMAISTVMAMATTAAGAQSCPASPNYTPDFSSNGNCLALNSNATLVLNGGSTDLQITFSSGNQVGSAWYNTPQTITNGFSTTFQFQFTNPSTPPADGIAFVIQNAGTTTIGYTGGNGGALGYGDDDANTNPSQGEGIPSSLAIEFDTFQNSWDPAPIGGIDSHIAIQSCGAGPNTSHHNYLCDGSTGPNSTLGQPVSTEDSNINLADGAVHNVTINYTPACSTCNPATVANIQVIVDGVDIYPNGIPVDFSSIVSSGGTAYVGFTGATGGDYETQDILNWIFAPTQQGQQINPNDPQSLNQTTVISSTPGQYLSFNFDDTVSNGNGTLTIQPGTTPFVSTAGVSQFDWATIVNGTAMADAPCLIANGQTVCAINTMTCTTSSNPNAQGANCPQSTARNILFDQEVDVLQNQTGIVNGILTIPPGYAPGMAMAPDALVTGSECTFPSGEPLSTQLCPQSIMTELADNSPHGGGTGTTTNSTYVFFCCEPEWQTTPTIPAWNDTTSVPAAFSSAPPPTPNPNTNNFQAAQGAFVVVGAEPHGTLLDTTYPLPAEQSLNNPISCPALGLPPATPWSTQNPQTFAVNGTITTYDNNGTASPLVEGAYDAHYFSVDCHSFEELVFPTSLNVSPGPPGPNVATFKTVPFNIDLTAPTVSYILNPGSSVSYQSALTAAVTCTDPISNGVASGISNCGGQATTPLSAPPLTTNPTVTVNLTLPTNSAGTQSYPLPAAVDQAGNLGGATNIPYTVTPVPLVITASSGTMTYGTTPPTISPSYSGFVGSDNSGSLTTQPTCTTAATSSSPVGNYSSSCSGAVDPNYTISYMAGSVAVTAASATISLGNLAQTYTGGALSPTVTTSPSGLSYLLAGAPDTNAGSYPVTATITNPNYTSTPASGTFVISPASATISLGNLTQSYTGSPLSPTVTTSPSGLTYLLTGAPDTSVGSYPVTATITNPNYSSTPASGTFVITGAIASISPTSLNFGTVENGRTVYKTVTLTNSGNVSMTITSIKISGGSDPDDFKETNKCGKSLAASASCVITVSYAADRDNYKGGTANLVITDSAAGSPQSVSISGKSER